MKLRPTSLRVKRGLLLISLCCNVVLATYVSVQWFRPGWTPAGAGMNRMLQLKARPRGSSASALPHMVMTGAADDVPERIAHLVFLDAFVPTDGQSMLHRALIPERSLNAAPSAAYDAVMRARLEPLGAQFISDRKSVV